MITPDHSKPRNILDKKKDVSESFCNERESISFLAYEHGKKSKLPE